MRKLIKVIFLCVLPVIMYYVISFNCGIVFAFVKYFVLSAEKSDVLEFIDANALWFTGLTAAISIPVFLLLMYHDSLKEGFYVYESRLDWDLAFVQALGGMGASFFLNVLIAFLGITVADKEYVEVNEAITSAGFMLQLTAVGIIVPIAEELMFRGLIFRRLRYYYNSAAAIIFSAIGFGVFHGNLTQGIYAFIMGLFLAYAYEVSESIALCIIIHAFANIASILVSVPEIGEFIFGNVLIFIGFTLLALIAFISAYIQLRRTR